MFINNNKNFHNDPPILNNKHHKVNLNTKSSTFLIILSIMLFLCGIFAEYSILTSFIGNLKLSLKGIHTTATVIGYYTHVRNDSDDTTITYSNKLEYYIENDMKIISEDRGISSNPPTHNIGDTVKISYDNKNPNNVIVLSPFNLYFVNIMSILLASLLLIFGGFTFKYALTSLKQK